MDVKAYTEYFRRMAAGQLRPGPKRYYVVDKIPPTKPKPAINIQHISPVQGALERAKGQVKNQKGGNKRKRDYLE